MPASASNFLVMQLSIITSLYLYLCADSFPGNRKFRLAPTYRTHINDERRINAGNRGLNFHQTAKESHWPAICLRFLLFLWILLQERTLLRVCSIWWLIPSDQKKKTRKDRLSQRSRGGGGVAAVLINPFFRCKLIILCEIYPNSAWKRLLCVCGAFCRRVVHFDRNSFEIGQERVRRGLYLLRSPKCVSLGLAECALINDSHLRLRHNRVRKLRDRPEPRAPTATDRTMGRVLANAGQAGYSLFWLTSIWPWLPSLLCWFIRKIQSFWSLKPLTLRWITLS